MSTAGTVHYLDHACYSPPSAETERAVRAAVRSLAAVGSAGATRLALDWLEQRDRTRGAVAELLGSGADDITLVESTSHGLGVVAGGLRLSAGENVVVADCDFVGVPTVWRAQVRSGVELRAARSTAGRLTLDAVRAAVDSRTRVISVSAVQEVSGWPVDLDGVAEIASSVGAVVVVDGIQEAGVLDRHPAQHGLAAYASGGHKWIRHPYGLGFLWTSPDLRARLRPPFQGYFALAQPAGGWVRHLTDPMTYSLDDHALSREGPALELGGTPNWLGAVGLETAVRLVVDTGPTVIESRALGLADELRSGLLGLGVEPYTPVGTRSTVVTFSLQPHADDVTFVDVARRDGVHVSARSGASIGGVRAGCHAHNTEDDIAALLALVARARGRAAPARRSGGPSSRSPGRPGPTIRRR
ncbi:MAG: aminotransferase class V-fold PLP-dependent enzyme [Nocardioidaceae bacterium]